ncbi:MAG: hypothetical protein AABX28_03560 [Nanoarchaeota archaeon]
MFSKKERKVGDLILGIAAIYYSFKKTKKRDDLLLKYNKSDE